MALRDKLAARATAVGAAAAEAAVVRVQHAGARYGGLRAVFKDEERPVTIENVLAALVAAVRADEHEEDRSARDVFKTARSRRRRLGLLSFGAGPLVGVATHIVDLYCETATVCDLADLHSIDLTEHDVAAHMLVLWGILESVDEAKAVMTGASTQSLASIIGGHIHDGVSGHIPEKLTKRAAIHTLWDARHLVDDARKGAGAGSVRGVVFTGHRTKQLIKKAELQLGVRRTLPRPFKEASLNTLGDGIDMNAELTTETLDAFLRDKYPDREPGDPEGMDELLRELVSRNYDSVGGLSAMLARNATALRMHEETNPPSGQTGSRFNRIGAVRISLAAEIPDYDTQPQVAEQPFNEKMARGKELEDAGDLAGAEAAYREADSTGVDASLAISRVCIECGGREAMRSAFDKAIERGHVTGIFNTGVILKERGNIDAAEVAYRAADAAGDICASCNLGILLEEKAEFEEAEAAYRRADDAGDGEAACCLGMMLEDRWDLDGALSAFQRAAERGNSTGALRLGTLLQDRGDRTGAEAAYQRCEALGDDNGALNLGVLFQREGDLAQAEVALERADALGNTDASYALGLVLYQSGNPEGARDAFQRALDGGHSEAADALAALQHVGTAHDVEAAHRAADAAGDPEGSFRLGELLESRGELGEAEVAYRRADERGHGAGAWRLGVLLTGRGEIEQGQAAYRRADERGDPSGALNVGIFLQQNGDVQAALDAYIRSEQRGNADAASCVGTLLEDRGDLTGAADAYGRGDANGSALAAYNLALLFERRKDDVAAEAAYRRADDRGLDRAAFNLGIILFSRNDIAGAEAAFRRADERGHADSANNLGVILLNQGNEEAARAAFRRASERGYPVPPELL